jgi:hypothetical protein
VTFASKKASGARRRGDARSLWPSALRNLAASRATPERILDVWARVHGRGPVPGPFASSRDLRDVMREDRARVGGLTDVDGGEPCAA